ncbi:hypothetical protein F5888DRAFT_1644324 [Russula emetica]|nr:hypothetical protein F5888DRAFT_1644324 [Russula emetica]
MQPDPSLRVGYPASPTMDPPFPPDFMPKIFINERELVDSDSADDIDIYQSGSVTSIKSISDTSSGSSRLPGGRFERAIARWARRNWADSSSSITSSGSSDSFRSSFRTTNSIADVLHREESERAIGRIVPREFNLYAPPPSSPQNAGPIEEEQQVVRTSSLDVMLPHLNPLLRNSGKHRRSRHRSRIPRTELDHHHHHHHHHPHQRHLDPRPAEDESSDTYHTDALCGPSLTVKGKDKMPSTMLPPDPLQTESTFRRDSVAGQPRQAWWLDVANPTWEDMKTLGRVNSLRRLLEPREKLESFPKLGYYLITFRAIEYTTPDERLEIISQKTGSSQLPVQGVANETCIYLVVFRDGICTFHFSDISEHLDRVRRKLKTTAQTTRRSSAWIAHGILDSVVDSFFPLVEEIEGHVKAIESVIHNEDNPASTITPVPRANTRALRILPAGETIPLANAWALPAGEKVVTPTSFADEKHAFSKDVASVKTAKTQFSLPRLTCGLMLRRWWRAISRFVFCMRNKPRSKVKSNLTRASFDLHRMARTRHLATSVARVLGTKPEVVAGIRKRLLASDGPDASDDAEVAIYFGDVQDHILTLQQSLAHYERMLNKSHPMYIQNLHFELLRARTKLEFAMFVLALLTVMDLPPSMVVGTYDL